MFLSRGGFKPPGDFTVAGGPLIEYSFKYSSKFPYRSEFRYYSFSEMTTPPAPIFITKDSSLCQAGMIISISISILKLFGMNFKLCFIS